MTLKKTLTNLVLAGALALSGTSCFKNHPNTPYQNSDKIKKTAEKQKLNSIPDIKTQPKIEYQPILDQTILGEIIGIDEDYFPVGIVEGGTSRYGGIRTIVGGVNFPYELIRVKNKEENIISLLSPTPTGYQVGDKVELFYRPVPSISFEELLQNYGIPEKRDVLNFHHITSLQIGTIKMDGIIKE